MTALKPPFVKRDATPNAQSGVMTTSVNGVEVVMSPSGGAYLPAFDCLLVADLHFEKGTALGSRGIFLPPYDTRATVERLERLIAAFRPARVVSLGDAFHDQKAEARMDADDARRLDAVMSSVVWTWVLGNHDPAPPARFAAETVVELRMGGLVLRHEPGPASAATVGEIAGHLHPCARVRARAMTAGHSQRRRCFVSDGTRMILPAFGAYTGGLNILDVAYDGLFSRPAAFVVGRSGVYAFSTAALAPDGPRDTAARASRRAG